MQGIVILYWALSILFCLAMVFAILLWCRSWRRDERAEIARQIQALSKEIDRLTGAVDMLEHTSASLQTADEQLARDIETLRKNIQRVRVPSPSVKPGPRETQPPQPAIPSPPQDTPGSTQEGSEADRYTKARALLQKGRSPLDVARDLDLGTAEIRMIARMVDMENEHETIPEKTEGKKDA